MQALLHALSDAELARQFQARTWARGRALAVQSLHTEPAGAGWTCRGQVIGSRPYAVQLWHEPGARLRGRCECAQATIGHACKHQVALALAWRAALAAETPPEPQAEDLHRFLQRQPAAALAERLLTAAAQHPALLDSLLQWQRGHAPPLAADHRLHDPPEAAENLLALATELQSHQRQREALPVLERAWRLHPGHAGVAQALLALYECDGWDAHALNLCRERFDRQPSAAHYHAVLKAAESAGEPLPAERECLWRALDARQAEQPGHARGLAGLRLQLWADEQRWDAALDWLQTSPRDIAPADALAFAQRLPPTHDAQAAAWLQALLARQLPLAAPPYVGELGLVRETLRRLTPQAGRLWLAWLKLANRDRPHWAQALKTL